MGGEWLAFVGVALGAVIGGTGLIGAFAGAVELSARGRLRRRVSRAQELVPALRDDSNARAALTHAAELDAIRLAALSVVTRRRAPRPLVGLTFAVMSSLALVLSPGYTLVADRVTTVVADQGPRPLILTALLVFVLVGMIVAMSDVWGHRSLYERRRDWVRDVVAGKGVTAANDKAAK